MNRHITSLSTVYLFLILLWIYDIYAADTHCKPVLIRTNPSIVTTDDHVVLSCEIISCEKVSRVIHEKTDVVAASIWTPVYEGLTNTDHHALSTNTHYDLAGRIKYVVGRRHFFEITRVTAQDSGLWRCIVVDQNNERHHSNQVQIIVASNKDVFIKPQRPKLVVNQHESFVCEIEWTHPETIIQWHVNATRHFGGTASIKQNDDEGLWSLTNIIELEIPIAGKSVLSCALTSKTGDTLFLTNITFDVKEPAKITFPNEEQQFTANSSSAVVIVCKSTGYRPRITWQRSGFNIKIDDQRYNITESSHESSCTSTLTLPAIELPLTCDNALEHDDVYTCTAMLELPYRSQEISKSISVKILHPPLIKEKPQTVVADESSTVTLRCEVCSPTNVEFEWQYDGKVLYGENVKYQQDGSVSISGNHPSGEYHGIVRNSVGYVDCVVYLANSGSSSISGVKIFMGFLLFCVLLSILGLIYKITSGNRKGKGRYRLIPGSGSKFVNMVKKKIIRRTPNSGWFNTTIQVDAPMSNIWRAKQENCAVVGGMKSPTLTFIDNEENKTNFLLEVNEHAMILMGLAIGDTCHLVIAHYTESKRFDVFCVPLNPNAGQDQNIVPTCTLNFNSNVQTHDVFKIDEFRIGVFCVDVPCRVDIFKIDDILYSPTASSVGSIQLDGHKCHYLDALCVNGNDNICVLSWLDQQIHMYDQNGSITKTVGSTGYYGPVIAGELHYARQMQCFSDKSLVVFCWAGDIHRYDGNAIKGQEWSIIKQRDRSRLSRAVFTKSSLYCIDFDDSTNIHLYKHKHMCV